jgi:hypothetical protein
VEQPLFQDLATHSVWQEAAVQGRAHADTTLQQQQQPKQHQRRSRNVAEDMVATTTRHRSTLRY